MIVLDENLDDDDLIDVIKRWYRGKVITINDLRPSTLVKDDSIMSLLHHVDRPVFVTINMTDFWGRVSAHKAYCVITFPFPTARIDEIPPLLRRFFKLNLFSTRNKRMGKVVQISRSGYRYYGVKHSERIRTWEQQI